VWGNDAVSGAISSRVKDPLTGNEMLRLRYAGVEVTSRMGFEKPHREQPWEFIAYTTTIANSTTKRVSVRFGGITVDGSIVPPLPISNPAHRRKNEESVDIARLYCFSSGFLSHEKFFTVNEPSADLIVEPQSSLNVSTVVKDPRHYPILCSVDGCLPKGIIRHSVQVGSHDYIFVWPGRSVIDCGR
jgi:hypothetical protein